MTKELATKEENLPVMMDFEDDAGAGFEDADNEAFAIPYLKALQKMSPQVDEDHAEYIEGAKVGMLFNAATRKLYDGKEGVIVIPAHYQRMFVEWVPKESGGGFRGAHMPSDPIVQTGVRNEKGKLDLANGNYLSDTRYHFCILIDPEDGPEPVVLCLQSTQIKKSKAWMTKMRGIRFERKDGKGKFNPPMFSHIYKVSTMTESKGDETWKGYKVELERKVGQKDVNAYLAAKDFREQVAAGEAQVDHSQGTEGAAPVHDDEVPF